MKKIVIITAVCILILGAFFLFRGKDLADQATPETMGEGGAKTKDNLDESDLRGHGDPSQEERDEWQAVTIEIPEEVFKEMRLTKEELQDKCQEYALGYGYNGGQAVYVRQEEDRENANKTYYQFTLITDAEEHPFTIIREVLDGNEDFFTVKDGTWGNWFDEES